MESLKEYAVVLTYDFDDSCEIYLFGDNYDKAVEFLKNLFEKELKTATEMAEFKETERLESWHNNDFASASITLESETCVYQLCSYVKRVV